MFDPTEWIGDYWFGYVCRHCKTDYIHGSPLRERLNPLRYTIGFGQQRPCKYVWNRGGKLALKWSNFTWELYRKRLTSLRERQNHDQR